MKQALVIMFLVIGIWPSASLSATTAELEARLQSLEDEIKLIHEKDNEIHNDFNQAMSVAGYTDAAYIMDSRDAIRPSFHLHHLSLFFKQHLNENWRFFSEIEFEDAPKFSAGEPMTILNCGADNICGGVNAADDTSTSINTLNDTEGKIFTEAFNIDFTWRSYANLRFGRFFTPAGIWSIDHYPPFVATQERPLHIRKIFPQTTDGVMIYGITSKANNFIAYDAYISNGENNTSHNDGNTHKAVGLRLNIDLPYLDRTNIGTTIYHDVSNNNVDKLATGLHTIIRQRNYELQAEYANALLKPQGGNNYHSRGYYLQGSYHINHWSLGLRYDFYNSDTRLSTDETNHTLFTNYHISANLNLKLEHHIFNFKDPAASDYNKTIISISANLGN